MFSTRVVVVAIVLLALAIGATWRFFGPEHALIVSLLTPVIGYLAGLLKDNHNHVLELKRTIEESRLAFQNGLTIEKRTEVVEEVLTKLSKYAFGGFDTNVARRAGEVRDIRMLFDRVMLYFRESEKLLQVIEKAFRDLFLDRPADVRKHIDSIAVRFGQYLHDPDPGKYAPPEESEESRGERSRRVERSLNEVGIGDPRASGGPRPREDQSEETKHVAPDALDAGMSTG